jgi:ribosomal protein L32
MDFKPTFLYIKQHSITEKLYFGKTTNKDPLKYNGSGRHWKSHIKKHGLEHVRTIWFCLFTDKEELIKFATLCSEMWNIVESDVWLNLKSENGLDGGLIGYIHSEHSKLKISSKLKGLLFSSKRRKNISKSLTGRSQSDARRNNTSLALIGHAMSQETKDKIGAKNKGKTRTLEQREKMSIDRRGKKLSEAAILNRKITANQLVICNHCGKEGKRSMMNIFHFKNCKIFKNDIK